MGKTYVIDESPLLDLVDEVIANNNLSELEKEEDYLMPDERELVKNGEYDDYSFEEEELEDDDYYGEDDE